MTTTFQNPRHARRPLRELGCWACASTATWRISTTVITTADRPWRRLQLRHGSLTNSRLMPRTAHSSRQHTAWPDMIARWPRTFHTSTRSGRDRRAPEQIRRAVAQRRARAGPAARRSNGQQPNLPAVLMAYAGLCSIDHWCVARSATIHNPHLPVREREQHRRVPRHHAWWRPVV